MDNSRKMKSAMAGLMEGAGRKGRPCREWIEDIEDWCSWEHTDSPRQRSMEIDGGKFNRHLWAFSP